MSLLELADSISNKGSNNIIKIEGQRSSSRPVVIVKTDEVYLYLDLTRSDTDNLIELLKGETHSIRTATHDCGIEMRDNQIVFTPSARSNKPQCTLLISTEEVQSLLTILEGWYDVISNHPLVKHLRDHNTIQCESYKELDDVFQILKQEGLRFRDGAELDATKHVGKAITPEHPVYISHSQNYVYTDSSRESDFVSCDFELYGKTGEILRYEQIRNM